MDRRNLILLAGLGAALLSSGCTSHRVNYQFEARPRAVLTSLGIQQSKDPKLAISSSGTLYMLSVYGDDGHARLGLAISHDGGDTFLPIVPISEDTASVSSHGENSPTLASTPTKIYALWEQATSSGSTELMLGRSLNFAHSFEEPVRVTDKTKPSFNGFSSMGVAPNGDVYAVWLDGRDEAQPAGTFGLYLARSTDQGVSFRKNVRVAIGSCPCCRPSVAFGKNGEVFIVWRKVFPGDIRDMVVSTSRDGGQTFAPSVRVATDNWKLIGCPHSGATILEDGGRLYVAWLTEETDGKARIRLSWSDDGAGTFEAPLDVSGNVLDPNHPALGRSEDGRVLLVFQGRDASSREGWNPIQPYVTEIRGTSISLPQPVPGNQKSIDYPALAVGTAGRAFIAWTENGDQGSNIALCRGRRGS